MPLDKPYLDVPGTTIFDAAQSRRGDHLHHRVVDTYKSVIHQRSRYSILGRWVDD
jgi:hypothetical protein